MSSSSAQTQTQRLSSSNPLQIPAFSRNAQFPVPHRAPFHTTYINDDPVRSFMAYKALECCGPVMTANTNEGELSSVCLERLGRKAEKRLRQSNATTERGKRGVRSKEKKG